MKSPYLVGINANLKKIDEILKSLHLVAKRSELKEKTDELMRLTEMVRQEAYLMSVDERYSIPPTNHSHSRYR